MKRVAGARATTGALRAPALVAQNGCWRRHRIKRNGRGPATLSQRHAGGWSLHAGPPPIARFKCRHVKAPARGGPAEERVHCTASAKPWGTSAQIQHRRRISRRCGDAVLGRKVELKPRSYTRRRTGHIGVGGSLSRDSRPPATFSSRLKQPRDRHSSMRFDSRYNGYIHTPTDRPEPHPPQHHRATLS